MADHKDQHIDKHGSVDETIYIDFPNKAELYKAYMPFVKNGGLFIPTTKEHSLGDELFVELGLPDESDKIPVSCRVVWITPVAAQGRRTPGIGVQFGDMGAADQQIQSCLGGILKSEDSTFTM